MGGNSQSSSEKAQKVQPLGNDDTTSSNSAQVQKRVRSTIKQIQKINSDKETNPIAKQQIKKLKIESTLIENVEKFQEVRTKITQAGNMIKMKFSSTNKDGQPTMVSEQIKIPSGAPDKTEASFYQDSNVIYTQHCKILDLTPQQGSNKEQIKKSFSQLIRKYAQQKLENQSSHRQIIQKKRQNRTKLLLAYQYLNDKLYDIHYTSCQRKIFETIYKGNVKELKKMINNQPQILYFRTKVVKYPLLYLAALSGHTDIVEALIRTGIQFNFQGDKSTALHAASSYGHYHVVKLLLHYGFPYDIKNSQDSTPIEQAYGQAHDLLQQAEKDIFCKLTKSLIAAKLCKTVVNIHKANGRQTIIKKILLPCYDDNFDDYVAAFHGTRYQHLKSIAIHGLKKPGTKIGDYVIQVEQGNIEENVEFEGDVNWAKKIYVSPSIHYAATYSHFEYYKDQGAEQTGWKPIVEVKVRKGSYKIFGDTTLRHERVNNEPQDLQYQIENEQDVKVVALMLVKRTWLGEFFSEREKDYNETNLILFNNEEQVVRKIFKSIAISIN